MIHSRFYSKWLIILGILAMLTTGCKKTDVPIIIDTTPPTEIISGTIYHIDMENKSLYDLFMIESLQGNVNRVSPFIWVLKTPLVEYDGPGVMVDRTFWLNTITDYEKVEFKDPFIMVRDFGSKISGCVIYDNTLFGNYISGAKRPQPSENLVAKLNVTAMLCAKYNAVALTIGQQKILIDKYGVDLPVLANTTTSDFSSWITCYRYMYNNFSQDLSTKMMANNSHYCLGMFDFLIKNKMFIINMRGNPTTLDQNLTDDIFNRCPSPSPVYGIWNLTGGEPNEDTFQRYLNKQGKYCVATLGAFNMSFTSGLPKYVPLKSETKRDLKYDPDKKYISFVQTDGDNYEFLQQVFPKKFESLGRTNYPIGWEIASTLNELDPVAAKWYYENRGENSYVNATAGAGYNKYMLPEEYQNEYFSLTDKYMQESKFRTIKTASYRLEDWRPLTNIPSVEGVFCGYGHNAADRPSTANNAKTHEICNNKPMFINYSYADIDEIVNYKGSSPAFFSIACVYTPVGDLINTINSLSDDWVVVSNGEMIDVYKQYAGVP